MKTFANIFMIVILVMMTYSVVVSFQWKYAINKSVRLDNELSAIMAENARLRAEEKERHERRNRVEFLTRDLKLENVARDGSVVSGYLQNYGTEKFGDIVLTVMVRAGALYQKKLTIKSTDGRPLGRWQRRPFTIALDIDPGKDAEWTVYIEDVEVKE